MGGGLYLLVQGFVHVEPIFLVLSFVKCLIYKGNNFKISLRTLKAILKLLHTNTCDCSFGFMCVVPQDAAAGAVHKLKEAQLPAAAEQNRGKSECDYGYGSKCNSPARAAVGTVQKFKMKYLLQF